MAEVVITPSDWDKLFYEVGELVTSGDVVATPVGANVKVEGPQNIIDDVPALIISGGILQEQEGQGQSASDSQREVIMVTVLAALGITEQEFNILWNS